MTWDGFSAYSEALHWFRLLATPIILLIVFLYMRLSCRPDENHGPRGRTGEVVMSDREKLYNDVQRDAHELVRLLPSDHRKRLWYLLTMTAHRKAPSLFASPPSDDRLTNEVGDLLTDAAFGDQEDE